MLLQVRTDNHAQNSQELQARVSDEVQSALEHQFGNRLRRVEVYLQDMNSHKGGLDTRCSMEAHIDGHQPVAVDHRAAGVDEAVGGALDRLVRALEHTLDRLSDRGGNVSMSGEPT